MAISNNVLQQVQTYQRSGLGFMLNLNCFLGDLSNFKFKDFQKIEANLGSSVTFDKRPRYNVNQGLVWSYQPGVQRVETLSVSQSANVVSAWTAQERIFNVEKDVEPYMKDFGMSQMITLGQAIETDIALNCISGVTNNITNLKDPSSGPYRFFGNGIAAINSYQQLAQMIANFRNFGSPHEVKVVLPDLVIPAIVGTGLNQFAPNRNNEIAMSWEIGDFGTPRVDYYSSNQLPIQYAGNVGNNNTTLTLVSVNDPTGANVTQLTFSGAGTSDANAIKYGDLAQFQDGVSGQPNLRFIQFIGTNVSGQPVQFMATADAASDGSGNVIVNIKPGLSWLPVTGDVIRINTPLVAGMQVKFCPSHRAGIVISDDALFVAMPQLPDQDPFTSYSAYDEDTGASIRFASGSVLGQNQKGSGYDAIWGSKLVMDNCMRIVFPLSQA